MAANSIETHQTKIPIMKADFTRDTFDPARHFSLVLSQQGRVTVDADANEQAAILLHYLRSLATDLIGPYAAPAGAAGFALTYTNNTLSLGAGRFYVHGILVENEKICSYSDQPDYPVASAGSDQFLNSLQQPQSAGNVVFGLYLDVWERLRTWIDVPSIREVALLGPDTCARTQVVWQVKAMNVTSWYNEKSRDRDLEPYSPCASLYGSLPPPSSATLSAQIDPGPVTETSPCVTPPASQYRGPENQLYRVEINDGGTIVNPGAQIAKAPTFKWSRDNGSVVTAWLGPAAAGYDLQVANVRGFAEGDWVELSDDTCELLGKPGVLVQLSAAQGITLTIDPSSVPASPSSPAGSIPASIALTNFPKNPKIRRWDQSLGVSASGVLPITAGQWVDLEDGVQVMFQAGTVNTGDYWLIPARVATGNIEWPVDKKNQNAPLSLPPRGIQHHYAPLGFVIFGGAATPVQIDPQTCGCQFEPIRVCAQKIARVTEDQVSAPAAPVPTPPAAPQPQAAAPQPPPASPPLG